MTDQFYDQNFGEWVEPDHAELVLPPLIQWRRGDLRSEDERLRNGCFQLPTERFELPGEQPVDCEHGGGKIIPSYLFKGLRLAVLAWRKDWFTGRGQNRRVITTYDPNIKAWSRIQIWAFTLLSENVHPFIFTFSGTNSMAIEDAINQFKERVLSPVSAKAKTNFPMYAFWMPIGPGGKETFDQGTYATPPRLYFSSKPEELFVGRENVEQFKAIYPQAKEWSKRVIGQGQLDDPDEGSNNGQPPPPSPPPIEYDDGVEQPSSPAIPDEIPF